MDVAVWLRGLGLGEYEAAFRANHIDAGLLPGLTADDLKEIGVVSLGHRKRLLDAIAALRGAPGLIRVTAEAPRAIPFLEGPPTPDPDALAPPGAERRQLTVLFCDLAGSTALSARLDPEDLRGVIAAYHAAVTDAVRGQGGYVAKFLGDGVLAYFGWPEAHEDDTERAVRAGLAAVDSVARLRGPDGGPLAARVGIATGPVVVGEVLGEGEARERSVIGETPNLAARLQAGAEPGAVVLDEMTHRLAGALFTWAELAPAELKGLPNPVPAWRALGVGDVESRFSALRTAAIHLPMLGRGEELELLLRRWRQARDGEGRVVLVRGEAGIGKSRLTAALQEVLAGEEREELLFFCSPQHTDSALHPVAARLERAAGFLPGDAPRARLAKLEALLLPPGPPAADVALVADLLSVDTLGCWPALADLAPQERRGRLLDALLRRLRTLAAHRPALVVVEDAHWIDPTTRELLDLLVAEADRLPLLLVVTHRPEFDAAAWIGQAHVTALQLGRLGRTDHRALLRRVAGGKALPPEIEAEVLARTDGVPLFVEEVTRSLLEGGLLCEEADRWVATGPLPDLAVPSSLQASLVARLDRLSSVREVAQAGAVLGREFSFELLAVVTGLPTAELSLALDRLVESGLVQRRGVPPDAIYTFRHALIRDAAEGTLLRGRRHELHAKAAAAIERLRPSTLEREPEVLAAHHAEAGDAVRAVALFQRAAELALGRAAFAETEGLLRRGRTLLDALPETAIRVHAAAELWLASARASFAARGYGAEESIAAVDAAWDAACGCDDPDLRLRALGSRWVALYISARFPEALAVADAMIAEGREYGLAAGELVGRYYRGVDRLMQARPTEAVEEFEAAIGLQDEARDDPRLFMSGHSALLGAKGYLAVSLLLSGRPETALGLARELAAEARQLGHAHTLAHAVTTTGRVATWLGLDETAREIAMEGKQLCAAKGLRSYEHRSEIYLGVTLARAGKTEEGLRLVEKGVAGYRAAGAMWPRSTDDLMRIECHLADGRLTQGLEISARAIAEGRASGDMEASADLHRLRGLMLHAASDAEAGETELRDALSLAKAQGARWWELRAARDLARLLRDQGRIAEACGLLAPVYAAFTEGLALPDLAEARRLLVELSAAPAKAAEGAPSAS